MDTNNNSSVDESDDKDSAVETASNCSYEETAAKIETVLRKNLMLNSLNSERIRPKRSFSR